MIVMDHALKLNLQIVDNASFYKTILLCVIYFNINHENMVSQVTDVICKVYFMYIILKIRRKKKEKKEEENMNVSSIFLSLTRIGPYPVTQQAGTITTDHILIISGMKMVLIL